MKTELLVLQGFLWDGAPHVWAETRIVGKKKGQVSHPFASEAKEVSGALAVTLRKSQHFMWLPSVTHSPLPSTNLLGDVPISVELEVKPWRVQANRLSLDESLKLGMQFGRKDFRQSGILPSDSLIYCLHAVQFATSLVARQQLIPALQEWDGSMVPRWLPVFLGQDRERLELLTERMPASVRAASDDGVSAPEIPAAMLLRDFLESVVDESARPLTKVGKPKGKKLSSHRLWASGLTAASSEAEHFEIDDGKLAETLNHWTQPLVALSTASHRLAFRLEEPAESAGSWLLRPMLQSMADQSLYLPVEDAWKVKSTVSSLKTFVLSELGNAAGIFPSIQGILKGKRPKTMEVDGSGAMEFLLAGAGALEQAGFRVILPAWWARTGTKQRLTAKGKARSTSSKSAGFLTMKTMVQFSWQLAIGDKTLTLEELRELAQAKSPLVKVRGQWVHVNAEEIQAALEFWQKKSDDDMTLEQVMQLALGTGEIPGLEGVGLGEIKGVGAVGKFLKQFQDSEKLELLPPPANFKATLRPYQVRGYSWLYFLQRMGLGACLADDMGLGKTIQALAMLQYDREQGSTRPVLLVCPTSVLGNWQREAAKFAPALRLLLHHGPERPKTPEELESFIKEHDVIVTTYSLLQRDLELFREVDWRYVVLDEAQFIKNHGTRQAKAARALRADAKIALSGTPVENHVGELWSIMDFLNPGLLGTQKNFDKNYFKPIQREQDERATQRLRRATAPFILRRLKTDRSIITDLPDKMENNVYCQLTKEQGSLYAASVNEVQEALNDADGIKRKGIILGLLTRLKQICNHPAQFLGDRSGIEGRSGKLSRLTEMIGEVLDGGERSLIFTQFTEMGDMMKRHLEDHFGREVMYLQGSVSKKKRDEMVARFQEDDHAPPIFLLSLRAGGTGITLTRASHVFHFDRWWNPAVEDQATDRAFRIGQKRNVQVHKFVCIGTMEEKIDAMIQQKKKLANSIVGAGEGWITELSNRDLKELLTLGKDAVIE